MNPLLCSQIQIIAYIILSMKIAYITLHKSHINFIQHQTSIRIRRELWKAKVYVMFNCATCKPKFVIYRSHTTYTRYFFYILYMEQLLKLSNWKAAEKSNNNRFNISHFHASPEWLGALVSLEETEETRTANQSSSYVTRQ